MKVLLLLTTLTTWAIDTPRIGFTRDTQNHIIPIDGIAGNLIAGDPIADDTLAFSWNGVFGIRKTDSTIEWWNQSGEIKAFDAPAGAVIIGYAQPQSALIYSKSAQTLNELTADHLTLQPILKIEEDVLALRGTQTSIDIAIRRNGQLFILTLDRTTGSTSQVQLTKSASNLLLLPDGSIVGIEGSTIWITRRDASEWTTDTGVTLNDLAQIGNNWIEATAPDRQFALQIRPGSDPGMYTIPQAAQQ